MKQKNEEVKVEIGSVIFELKHIADNKISGPVALQLRSLAGKLKKSKSKL
ncbi:hypothetical protein KAR91_38035 [Candidatus Pacearchaeota archaeon]|nr:hypothetical protein [Candidatus Pacearchaeota archaeon]